MLSCVLVMGACGSPDSRAYSDTDSRETLDDVLARFGITLPSCPVEHVRFSVSEPPTSGSALFLKFDAAPDCVQEFLRSSIGDDAAVKEVRFSLTGRGEPFFGTSESYGWKLDPARRYYRYGDGCRKSGCDIVVDDGHAQYVVYIHALTDSERSG